MEVKPLEDKVKVTPHLCVSKGRPLVKGLVLEEGIILGTRHYG